MTWQASNAFGWGILGLNVFCHWAVDPEMTPLMVVPFSPAELRWLDPLRMRAVGDAVRVSDQFAEQVGRTTARDVLQFDCPVIHSLGNGFAPTRFRGTRNWGRTVFEDTRLHRLEEKMEPYDALIVASTWARDLVAAHTAKPVHLIHEGIDPSLFCPGPRSALLDPRKFYVFTGGKIEFRKAQDLVVLAFRAFAQSRRDAVLVTSWHSPWPRLSEGFRGSLDEPLRLDAEGRIDSRRWATDNGIRADQFLDIGPIPNQFMPQVLREMDVSLQTSRAEACTNLPAKEAMACGVPVIIAANTGTRDLIDAASLAPPGQEGATCLPLRAQAPVPAQPQSGTEGWGESDVDEIVAALEFAYDHRDRARAIGRAGAAWLIANDRTWQAHASALKVIVCGS